MKKILITGATDGIGKLTARSLLEEGHLLLIHGRSQEKLERVLSELSSISGASKIEAYRADLSDLKQVERLASEIGEKHSHLDVLINNAGILKTSPTTTPEGLDVRFVVNTIAPYLLTRRLLPLLREGGRIINLSSAAQASVSLRALRGETVLDDMGAYSQSKLAITMWTTALAEQLQPQVLVVSVNPGSLLASKMVKEGFGVPGKDLRIGADILCKAALSEKFSDSHGLYFDNDSGRFADPHSDAADKEKRAELIQVLDEMVAEYLPTKDQK